MLGNEMRWRRIARGAGIAAAGFVLAAALLILDRSVALRRSLPQVNGAMAAPGLSAPVEVLRDRNGIPHIRAASRDDALYALGVAHAQDRLWQMELTRRIAQGRLAEIFGPPAASFDILARTLGLYADAERMAAAAAPSARAALAAYAAGVNAALAAHIGPLPPEFAIFLHRPEPWRPADSAAVIKLMAVQLSGNLGTETGRALLAGRLSREQLQQFFAPPPGEQEYPIPDPAYLKGAAALAPLFAALGFNGPRGASNNWAVAGSRSASGKPMLANDPHLGLTAPSVWYLAHLDWGAGKAIGGTLPGLPAIIAGRNVETAIGLTTTGADVMDLVLERVDPGDSGAYLTPEGPRRFESREETVRVRFGADRTITIRATRNGPVLPLEEAGAAEALPDGHVVALRWSGQSANDQAVDAAIGMLEAGSWEAFLANMRSYGAPVQSFAFANAAGDIGLLAPGFIPVRADGQHGLLPVAGWMSGADWTGLLPFDDLPRIHNPESGAVFSANGNILPSGYAHFITADWEPPFRRDRIAALLSEKRVFTREDMAAMQNDIFEPYAAAVLPLLADTPANGPASAQALALLRAWDRRMAMDRPEPLIFAAWMRALSRAVYADELGDRFEQYWGYRPNFMLRVLSSAPGYAAWCDDVTTPEAETCPAQGARALETALEELASAYGDDMTAWRWAEAHPAVHAHRPFGFVPLLRSLFGIETPMAGGAFTLSRADHRFASARPYAGVHGAGLKFIVDWGAPEESLWIVSTGQSGNPYSRHYGDLAELWAYGGYLQMTTDRNAIEAAAASRLVLQPSANPR